MERVDEMPADELTGSVLVVDDSRIVRFMVASHLRSAGYDVSEAENGVAALSILAAREHDVVITDLRMPELDGLAVLEAVKESAPDTEVIILTGSHALDVDYAVRALRLGAHDYMVKPPPSADAVVMTVQRAIEKKRLKEANRRLLQELATLSRTDALTGLPNRRSFEEALAREIARARRHGDALGLLMLDLDHFKGVNDAHGHACGDDVLRAIAGIAARQLREEDLVYRIGGEEFVVLLPQTDLVEATRVAERILKAVRTASIDVEYGTHALKVTASAGAAILDDADVDGRGLLSRADAALYSAKRSGRDRVHMSTHGAAHAQPRAAVRSQAAQSVAPEMRAH